MEETRKEYAFCLKNGRYRFLIESNNGIVNVLIEGEGGREGHLILSLDEYVKLSKNFLDIANLFQGDSS